MDLRQFQDCKYFLQGACLNGASCPFAHDEAKAARLQAARAQAAMVPREQQDCYFFSVGQCNKGDRCQFRHDPSKVVGQPAGPRPTSIEEKLSRPLGAVAPAARPQLRPPADDNLILQLDSPPVGRGAANPRPSAAAPGRGQAPAAGRGPQRPLSAAGGHGGMSSGSVEAGRGRGGVVGGGGAEGPRDWGPARPGRAAPAGHQAAEPARLQRTDRGDAFGGQHDMREARQRGERSNGAAAMSLDGPSPRKRRSVLDRLGPRVEDPSSDSDARRRGAARASSSERDERPAKRQSTRAETVSLNEVPSARSRVSAASQQLQQQRQPDRMPARRDSPLQTRGNSSSSGGAGAVPKLLAGARLGVRSSGSSGPEARAAKQPSLADAAPLGGCSRTTERTAKVSSGDAAKPVFAPPKSREELRKERERAALGKPLQSSQQPAAAAEPSEPSKPSMPPAPAAHTAAAAPSQPARKRTPIPVPGQHLAAAAKPAAATRAKPAAMSKPSAAPRSAAPQAAVATQPAAPAAKPVTPAAKAVAAAKATKASTPRAAAAVAKSGEGPVTGSTEFKWDVEGIEDAEDDFENDLDLDADADADMAVDAGASKAAAFDEELAEFENAFD